MGQNPLNELAKEKFLEQIHEIADKQGVTTDAAFSRWICEEFLRLEDDNDIETDDEIKTMDLLDDKKVNKYKRISTKRMARKYTTNHIRCPECNIFFDSEFKFIQIGFSNFQVSLSQ